jgi:two-component system, LytTR family, response regulator
MTPPARPLRVLLVDDEPPAIREMRRLLTVYPDLEIVGDALSVQEAVIACATLRPAVVFADIQMPDGTGFDLLAQVPEPAPRFVFVTAHDTFAIRAFEVNAIDYLLKPVEPQRLAQTVQRLLSGERLPARAAQDNDPVLVKTGREIVFVAPADIVQIVARGDYTVVETCDRRSLVTHKPLGEWSEEIAGLLRIHRSALVNRKFIVRATPGADDVLRLHFGNGASGTVECSRRQSAVVLRELNGN